MSPARRRIVRRIVRSVVRHVLRPCAARVPDITLHRVLRGVVVVAPTLSRVGQRACALPSARAASCACSHVALALLTRVSRMLTCAF
eukprot:3926853-Rhodomonas_salina.5